MGAGVVAGGVEGIVGRDPMDRASAGETWPDPAEPRIPSPTRPFSIERRDVALPNSLVMLSN